jgi:transposase-like protein
MSDFKGRHFEGEIVLWAVRWYCRYGVSYRDLEQVIGERGVSVDHSTIYRWVQRYAPEIEKRLRWQWRGPRSASWRVDETYVKVRGRWAYLYRALDKHGNTIEFYLSPTRNTAAAKRFLGKALTGLKDWEKPSVINTDKAPTYAAALAELKAEGRCPADTLHRQVKYLNNVIEPDHGKLKQLIRPVRGFKTMKTAYATINSHLRAPSTTLCNICGRPHRSKGNLQYDWRVGWVLTSVRPLMRPSYAAGPYGSSRTRSKSVPRARSTLLQTGCLIPSLDRCAIPSFRPPLLLRRPRDRG